MVTSYYPPVMKVHCELTLEQAAMMYRALQHLRASAVFALNAKEATDAEREEARHDVFVIDRLKGMFE